jgi:hypothetical protein
MEIEVVLSIRDRRGSALVSLETTHMYTLIEMNDHNTRCRVVGRWMCNLSTDWQTIASLDLRMKGPQSVRVGVCARLSFLCPA